MKTILIILLLLPMMVFAEMVDSVYNVGQTNANVTSALAKALAQPDSNTVYRNALLTKLNKSDSTIYLTPADAATIYQPLDSDLNSPDVALNQLDETYSAVAHTHTEFCDTIPIYFGVMDTVTTGDYIPIKIPNNYTVIEISASCNTGTVTFNIEERAETTPYSAGTDIMTSDLVADDNQQETTTFSNAVLAKNNRVCLVVTSITGDPTIFEVSMVVIKTN